ncbi:hypothetical protein RJ527_15410 [Thalassospiraceae bacterium LMO-SO8]|nr:hypothetical protein [Alphaproteobacteria bacterium LMO-S08]WND75411.1 hypothetical protein RJ527_15410 [Thalassospiraceae bacterium LMO-SO8]
MAASSDDGDWRTSIADLKQMAHDVVDLPPSIKHMIEQAWLAAEKGQEAMARELLAQAKRKIES